MPFDCDIRKGFLDLVREDGLQLAALPPGFQADPDLVLTAVENRAEAVKFASAELLHDYWFALEVVCRRWRALEFLPEELRSKRSLALAAARCNAKAAELVPPALREDYGFQAQVALASSKARGPLVYEGECLRLVGYCNEWRTTDAELRFRRLGTAGAGSGGPAEPRLGKGSCVHRLTARLADGYLSFQAISCARLFSVRIAPVTPDVDGFFRLRPGDRSAVEAVVSNASRFHGSNFFIEERAGALVSIYIEILPGSHASNSSASGPATQADGAGVAVWYVLEAAVPRGAPCLNQLPGRQKPKWHKDPAPEVRAVESKGGGAEVKDGRLIKAGDVEVEMMIDADRHRRFADLVAQAKDLSKRTFSSRFRLRELADGLHVTLLAADGRRKTLGFCLYMIVYDVMWIKQVAVEERHRGKGLGAALVRWAMGKARASGCEAVQVESVEEAVPFYKAIGFDVVGADLYVVHMVHLFRPRS